MKRHDGIMKSRLSSYSGMRQPTDVPHPPLFTCSDGVSCEAPLGEEPVFSSYFSVATPLEGSSPETDRIISYWRPRLLSLVDDANAMALDIKKSGWREKQPYICCSFLITCSPSDPVLRVFIDQACEILLEAKTSEEIMHDDGWPEIRKFDARDVRKWIQRWGECIPDEKWDMKRWSAFMECDSIEGLYIYVHSLVSQYRLELLESHIEWTEMQEIGVEREGWHKSDLDCLPHHDSRPEEIIYFHPRLFLDERAFQLTPENAEDLRDWAFKAFCLWHREIDEKQKEALVDATLEADELCPIRRWADHIP